MTDPSGRREMCWRVVEGPSGRLVVCAIYQTADGGVDLRLSDTTDLLLRSERHPDAASARARAEQWLSAFRAAGCIGT